MCVVSLSVLQRDALVHHRFNAHVRCESLRASWCCNKKYNNDKQGGKYRYVSSSESEHYVHL